MEKAVSAAPNLAGPHEELGFLDLDSGKDEDAQREWKNALALDPNLHRSLFAITMLHFSLNHAPEKELLATQVTLRKITKLAPNFAPAYVELALIEWKLGLMPVAFNDAHKAEQIEPWRAGYRLLTAGIQLQSGQPTAAALRARYVAAHWTGPDHNEAVDLWNQVPKALQGDGPPLVLEKPAGSELVRGTIQQITCGDKAAGTRFSVLLLPDSLPNATTPAAPITFTASGGFAGGFSDTFWWGEDHFSYCQHHAGERALIAYKPTGPRTGDLLDFELRDEVPTAASPSSSPESPKPVAGTHP